MSIVLQDPHNHVPAVSPGDGWDDAGDFDDGTALPARRAMRPTPAGKGLRIESKPEPAVAADAEPALEIQEIDGSVVRLTPEEPGPPPVWRQVLYPEQALAGEEAREAMAEPRRWGAGRLPPVYWLVGTGVGVTLAVVAGLVMLPAINRTNAARPDQAVHLVIDPRESTAEFASLKRMSTRQAEAEQAFLAFASAGSAAEVLACIHDADRIAPLLAAGRSAPEVPAGWSAAASCVWAVAGKGRGVYGVLEGSLPDFSRFRAYFRESGERLVLDWKASTAFGTAGFEELAAGDGDGSEIRGLLRASSYYNLAFPEAKFRSYQLGAPDGEHMIWCYARRGSAAAGQLATLLPDGEVLKGGSEAVRVTLRLGSTPESAQPNQWLIEEVLHNEWISP